MRSKPPTAGIRILTVDGGGVRGIVPLKALLQLEEAMNHLLGYSGSIQEHFDLAFGTSSGREVTRTHTSTAKIRICAH
jgi:patatin-like phospholipase/acyl hydrolase